MIGRAKVFGGMLVLGRVAAADMPVGQAHPQMDPTVLHLQALFTAGGARLDIADLIVGAGYLGHDSLPIRIRPEGYVFEDGVTL